MKRAVKRITEGGWWNHDDTKDPLSDAHAEHKPRGKKNTRKWCKGKPGVEHVVVTVVHHSATGTRCGASTWMPHRWLCRHAMQCVTCGKYLNEWLKPAECPDYKGELLR